MYKKACKRCKFLHVLYQDYLVHRTSHMHHLNRDRQYYTLVSIISESSKAADALV